MKIEMGKMYCDSIGQTFDPIRVRGGAEISLYMYSGFEKISLTFVESNTKAQCLSKELAGFFEGNMPCRVTITIESEA